MLNARKGRVPLIKLVFDADMILYVACNRNEQVIEWEDGMFTLHCYFDDVKNSFDEHVSELVDNVLEHYNYHGSYEIVMCLSHPDNFRKRLVDEEYKANRNMLRRPLCYKAMREWILQEYNTLMYEGLEADDVVGITVGKNDVAISGDKDFRCIPCKQYDFLRNEFFDVSKEDADYFHLYQTLIGDSTDGYKGCPHIGDVRAKRILDESPTWDKVVDTYIKNGSTEEEALKNARLAFILRKGYYNKKTKEVRLWTP